MGLVLSRMTRDGVLVAMKREEEEMSVSFSVREEEEEEEEETETREEEKGSGAKRWSSERRRDGMELGYGLSLIPSLVSFFFNHANPRGQFFFLRPSELDKMDWMDVPLL